MPLSIDFRNGREVFLRRLHEEGVSVPHFMGMTRLHSTRAAPPNEIHSHPHLEVHYLVRGQQIQVLGGQTFRLTPGDVLVAHAGVPHFCGAYQARRVEYNLSVDLRGANRHFLGMQGDEATALRRELKNLPPFFSTDNTLYKILDRVIEHYDPKRPYTGLLVGTLVTQFLVGLVRASGMGTKPAVSAPIARAAEMFRTGANEKITVSQVARQVGLSPSGLLPRFTREMGMGPKAFLTHERLELAMKRLRETRQSVTEIAHDLGFSSSQHFAKIFRQVLHRTPGDYRKTEGS